jgi:acetoin utilization protein AcuB
MGPDGALTASDVMVTARLTVDLDATLGQVRALIDDVHAHHLVVLDGEEVIGVLTQSDVLRALSPNLHTASETSRDLATLTKRVHQVMTHHPVVATADTPIAELVDAFRSRPIGCIPIVDPERRLLGLVTVRSLLFAAFPVQD